MAVGADHATGLLIERKRAPYAGRSCDYCKRRRLRCHSLPELDSCIRCLSKNLICSGSKPAKHEDKVHDIWLSRVENNPYARPDTNSVRLPDPVVATKALAASRSLSTLFSLTNRHVSYLFSFHLLNVHMSSDIVRLPDHCWAAFQLAFAKTGEMGRGVNELFFYLQLFEDRSRLPRRAVARRSDSRSFSIFTPLELEALSLIEELKLDGKSFEDQEESLGLLLHALDTVEAANETGWIHRLFGIGIRPTLPLVGAQNKYQRVVEFGKEVARNDLMFSTAYGVEPRTTRSDFNYLFGGDAALLPLYTLTTADYDLLLSPPPITSPLLELVWERIIPPLDRILLHSARILLVSIRANPTTEAFAIWDLAAAAFDWTDQLLALLSGDNRFWSDNKTPQNAQFTVRQIISYEQLLIWVMLAVHTTLARSPLLSDDRTSWIVLSRDKLRATVHRLANRGNTLVALTVRPVHFARILQFSGRTVEMINKALHYDLGDVASYQDHQLSTVEALRFASQSGPKADKLTFITRELEVGMRALSLDVDSPTPSNGKMAPSAAQWSPEDQNETEQADATAEQLVDGALKDLEAVG